MKMSYRLWNQRRRGVVAVQVALMLPVLMGFAVITVDVGAMYNARTDMQRAADAAALAAATEFAYYAGDGESEASAFAAAEDFVERNAVMGRTLTLDGESDIIFGRAYYDVANNTYDFVAGDAPTNAVRIIVRHSEDSPNGPLPLYFAGVLGKNATNVSASATALFVPTCTEFSDCYDTAPEGRTMMCNHGDSDDSDDSEAGTSDDSDDSDSGDSGSSDDSVDSTDSGDSGDSDSEGNDSSADSDAGTTIIVDTGAVPLFLSKGATLGACDYCPPGDSDDSDDSQGEFGPPDSSDSDDSDSGDSDGSTSGDSDDSDDSQGEFGPPDSDDSDDSDSGDSDGSTSGDSDDSDDSDAGTSDDSDDSDPGDGGDSDDSGSGDSDSGSGMPQVTICHIPPGNPGNPQTITVGSPSVPAHLAHGDVLGTCTEMDCAGSIKVFLIE
jgi:Flp pilus assembly protein TadG